MTESKEKTEKRDKWIRFRVTGSEKKNMMNYAKNLIPRTSLSEFIRIAIADKIRNIEHPELMNLNTKDFEKCYQKICILIEKLDNNRGG